MIIVRLMGGLGNQMFEYAIGRRLADQLHVPLKLDVSWFREQELRHYSLWALSIREDVATDAEVSQLIGYESSLLRRLVRRAIPGGRSRPAGHVRERTFAYDPRVLEVSDGAYLDGYWQSDKYFAGSVERLRAEYTFLRPLAGQNLEVADQIRQRTSVSLHIRRGDYVSDDKTAEVHGTCDAAYYQQCIEYLAEYVKDPVFFVFSDEPDWARENLDIPYPTTVVSHNDASRDFEDLRLMSLCHHHVIANSSFSWWGAWLDPEPSKIVLMPKRWFHAGDPEAAASIRPAGWIAL